MLHASYCDPQGSQIYMMRPAEVLRGYSAAALDIASNMHLLGQCGTRRRLTCTACLLLQCSLRTLPCSCTQASAEHAHDQLQRKIVRWSCAEEGQASHLKAAVAKQIGIHVPGPFTSACTSVTSSGLCVCLIRYVVMKRPQLCETVCNTSDFEAP